MKKHFFEYLFSLTNEGTDKVLTLFGVEMKFRRKQQERLHSLNNRVDMLGDRLINDRFYFVNTIWETCGAREDLLNYFEFASCSLHAWLSYHHQIWLTYLSCLIELKQTEKARFIFEKYTHYHGLLDVERYLTVVKFAVRYGYLNHELEKASFVYDTLLEHRQKDLFKRLFDGKNVAVVGNGPSEIGKNKGAKIDAHDIVVRFNNYRTTGFEKDYGSKTDVWARGSGGDDVVDRENDGFKLITWEADYDHWYIRYNHLDLLYRQLSAAENVYNFDFENHFSLRNASGILYPTTGLVFIWEIYRKFGNFDNFDFYGFNFCQDQEDMYATHYFPDRSDDDAKNHSMCHRFDLEALFLRKFMLDKKTR